MSVGRPDDGGFHENGVRLKLTPAVSSHSFNDDRLFHLARMRGDDPRAFDPLFVREDTHSRHHIQTYAVAAMPSAQFEIMGEGLKHINKVVGWMRARVTRLYRGHKPLAEIEETYVDADVPDPVAVREFLLKRLQERVAKSVKVAGLSVDVPIESVADVAHYMRHGFVPATQDGSELIWTSDN